MNQLKFSNGDIFPNIGLGTWLSMPNEVYTAVIESIKAGYRHIDCAYMYKNEKEIGDALHYAFSSGLVRREEMFITSKLWNSDHNADRVKAAIKTTLQDLRLDYLDLYLMHWPIAYKPGVEHAKTADDLASLDKIPLEETWNAMYDLKLKGLTKHIGVSNFSIKKINDLITNTHVKPENNQVELHPYFQQNALHEFCNQNEILLTAYAPLGTQRLIKTEQSITEDAVIKKIALKHNCSEAQVILAWGISRGISVIPKSSNKERIISNYQSINIQLSETDIHEISLLDRNFRLTEGQFAILPNGYYTIENIWD